MLKPSQHTISALMALAILPLRLPSGLATLDPQRQEGRMEVSGASFPIDVFPSHERIFAFLSNSHPDFTIKTIHTAGMTQWILVPQQARDSHNFTMKTYIISSLTSGLAAPLLIGSSLAGATALLQKQTDTQAVPSELAPVPGFKVEHLVRYIFGNVETEVYQLIHQTQRSKLGPELAESFVARGYELLFREEKPSYERSLLASSSATLMIAIESNGVANEPTRVQFFRSTTGPQIRKKDSL